MRTPLTPSLPTGILLCAPATTVSGSSTTTRAGDFNLLTLGVTASLVLISIWMPSAPCATFTFRSWLCEAEAETLFDAAAAGAGA